MAARQHDIPSVGIDINPVSVRVTRAKSHNYTEGQLRRIREQVDIIVRLHSGLPSAKVPALGIIDKVFKPDILEALLTARHIIDEEPDPWVHDFLLVGWLSILERVSNVFKEGNGIKYRNRKRTASGYITIPWEQLHLLLPEGFALVTSRLAEQYGDMLADLDEIPYRAEPLVVEGTALRCGEHVESGSVSLCVFSPPYCNNFNYMKIFKVELWMGGFVDNYKDLLALNHRALRSHVETVIDVPAELHLPEELHRVLEWVRGAELWHAKIPGAILAYFVDMRLVLEQIWGALESGGQCHIVVGNSAYGGVVVPTDLLLAKIANDIGYDVEQLIVARHLTTSSQQRAQLNGLLDALRETVIILRKPR